MISGKKFLFFLGSGLLLIAAWAIYHQWQDRTPAFPPSFDIERVERIQFGKASPSSDASSSFITLVKTKQLHVSDWRIPDLSNARVDGRKVERLLQDLRASKGKLVGRDPVLFSNFGLRNDEAFQISLFDGNWTPLLALLIGAKKEGIQTFIREPGSNQVYRVNVDLLEAMGIKEAHPYEAPSHEFWVAPKDVSLG